MKTLLRLSIIAANFTFVILIIMLCSMVKINMIFGFIGGVAVIIYVFGILPTSIKDWDLE